MKLREILEIMVKEEASDLYLRTKAKPRARINGAVEIIMSEYLTRENMLEITNTLLTEERHRRTFVDNYDVDFIHDEPGVGRFRVNIFMQRGTPAVVARHVLTHVKTFEELNLPVELCKLFAEESKGLLLVCGPAGNGKSTAIASMIEYVNMISSKHIITIEDPIEFLFADKQSIINQREIGFDVPNFPSALKHVTQQSPDIIYIGNIRDEETMRAVINATELGAFVMTTFHTINATQTLMRMVNFFPPHLHDEVRSQLSMILRGVISLRLLPCRGGLGRVPAYETMVVTPTVSRLIRENRIKEIQDYIDDGKLFGMQSFKQSLVKLVKQGVVDADVARYYADSKDDFDLELKGIRRAIS
ncbi:MAG: PilT/PilU family type 4a pilus ATPase [Candidatus Omnitrophica bacterium]|nr:PilT/PilU family type 4a pilus ATPase [Candidatus Omnitrophota bacterium]